MTQANPGSVVTVQYVTKLDDGTVVDSTQGREAAQFTLGKKEVLPGLEDAVVGMRPGEKKTAEVPPEKAFGPRREDLLVEVDRKRFPPNIDLAVGQRLEIGNPEERTMLVSVAEIKGEFVMLDANHPLAGRKLLLDIEVIDVKG